MKPSLLEWRGRNSVDAFASCAHAPLESVRARRRRKRPGSFLTDGWEGVTANVIVLLSLFPASGGSLARAFTVVRAPLGSAMQCSIAARVGANCITTAVVTKHGPKVGARVRVCTLVSCSRGNKSLLAALLLQPSSPLPRRRPPALPSLLRSDRSIFHKKSLCIPSIFLSYAFFIIFHFGKKLNYFFILSRPD